VGEEDWVAGPKSVYTEGDTTVPEWVFFQASCAKKTKTVLFKVVLNYGAGIKQDFISPDISVCNHAKNGCKGD